jgi:hypothetical protein
MVRKLELHESAMFSFHRRPCWLGTNGPKMGSNGPFLHETLRYERLAAALQFNDPRHGMRWNFQSLNGNHVPAEGHTAPSQDTTVSVAYTRVAIRATSSRLERWHILRQVTLF